MSATVFDRASARRVGRATLEVERAQARGGLAYLYKNQPESVSHLETVYLWGRRYVATGTRARFLWVHYGADPPYAEWSTVGIDWSAPDAAMPTGVEIIDTNENALHFPFGG
jgi:hypothetical protein